MLQDLQDFLEQPFRENMNATDWFLFYGLLLVIALLWHIIIKSLTNV
jgi:hypothetical protein